MHKITTALAAILIFSAISIPPASATPSSDALGTCLADNTTGKDRKNMARWIFIAMSAHPEMHDISKVSKIDQDEVDKQMGNMITKLLTESCPAQAKRAMDEGTEAFKTAFSVVGQLAMQELMNNPDVKSSIAGFQKYMNKDKINAVFEKK
ncbi:MAG: hypothetical protein WCA64_08750 [Gallionella sp.]